MIERRSTGRGYSQKRINCPICSFDCSVNNMGRHIQFKHKDVWENWRDYHLEWDSEISFLEWLRATFKKRENK